MARHHQPQLRLHPLHRRSTPRLPPSINGNSAHHYGKYEAQDYVERFAEDIGIEIMAVPEHHYVMDKQAFLPEGEIKVQGLKGQSISSQ